MSNGTNAPDAHAVDPWSDPEILRGRLAELEGRAAIPACAPCGCGQLCTCSDGCACPKAALFATVDELHASVIEMGEYNKQADAEVKQLREWQREVCDRYGYDSEEPGAADEVLASLPFWLGEEAAKRDAMAHVKALCDAEDERVAEVNARFAAQGITFKTGQPLTITGILPSLEVRHALFGPDSIEEPCPKHPHHRAEDCIPCAVGA